MVGVLVSVGGLGREAALSIALLDRSISYGSVVVVGAVVFAVLHVRVPRRRRPCRPRGGAVRALVTGGAGFIGSTLADALVGDGRRGVGRRRPLARASAHRCPTLADFHQLDVVDERLVGAGGGDRARGGLPPRRADRRAPLGRASRCSTRGSTCSAPSTSSRRARAPACAASSSPRAGARCTATPTCCPTPETHPCTPASAYGAAKLAGETYGSVFAAGAGHGVRRAALRQRLRAAPGPPRRGGRGGDLRAAAPRRRGRGDQRRRHARRATTCTSTTSSPPTCARRRRRRWARTTSAPAAPARSTSCTT